MRLFPIKAKPLAPLHSEQQDHENGHHHEQHHDNHDEVHGIETACAAATAAPEQDLTGGEEEDDYDSDAEYKPRQHIGGGMCYFRRSCVIQPLTHEDEVSQAPPIQIPLPISFGSAPAATPPPLRFPQPLSNSIGDRSQSTQTRLRLQGFRERSSIVQRAAAPRRNRSTSADSQRSNLSRLASTQLSQFAVRSTRRGSEEWLTLIKPFCADLVYKSLHRPRSQSEVVFRPYKCHAAVVSVFCAVQLSSPSSHQYPSLSAS
jgi:hypothetical protein